MTSFISLDIELVLDKSKSYAALVCGLPMRKTAMNRAFLDSGWIGYSGFPNSISKTGMLRLVQTGGLDSIRRKRLNGVSCLAVWVSFPDFDRSSSGNAKSLYAWWGGRVNRF